MVKRVLNKGTRAEAKVNSNPRLKVLLPFAHAL